MDPDSEQGSFFSTLRSTTRTSRFEKVALSYDTELGGFFNEYQRLCEYTSQNPIRLPLSPSQFALSTDNFSIFDIIRYLVALSAAEDCFQQKSLQLQRGVGSSRLGLKAERRTV